MKIRNIALTLAATMLASATFAQVGTAVKETGKAAAQSTMQAGDNAKAAMSSEPNKTINKTKAAAHKSNARRHRAHAKAAADAAAH